MTLVLQSQPSIVVSAIAFLLSSGQWDESIEYARKQDDASSMSDEELAEVVRAFGLLVQEESALLVKGGVEDSDTDNQGWKAYETKREIGNIILEVTKKVG
ncbi:unnamed protein product [Arabis nemorensis]|uniref:Uncharacterized protein n=1 Tax=Arabis nemorensis TaxID=586526 RepID=A0A565B0X5_9BRAS|nr:unnamed protein product [Arabis nemorensis]